MYVYASSGRRTRFLNGRFRKGDMAGLTRKEFLVLGGKAALGLAAASFFDFLRLYGREYRDFVGDVLQSAEVRKIHERIRQNKQRHIEKIQAFLRQPSVSSWNMGIRECAEMLMGYFKELGCQHVQLVETGGHPGVVAYYEASPKKKTVARYFMYDTQPFVKERWSVDPLSAELRPMGPFPLVVMARGAINSKGPLRAFLNALETILEVTGTLPLNIVFCCDGEEEQGSPHFHKVVEAAMPWLKRCSALLNPDPSQTMTGEVNMSLGNKGIASVELECHGARWGRGPQVRPIHSSMKAILDSPVWRLVQALASMVDATGNRILIEGYYDPIRPPNEEEEALIQTLLRRFPDRVLNLIRREPDNVRVFANDWTPEQALRHLMFDTTLNIDGLWAGYTGPGMATILPEKAAVKLDSRLVPNQSIDQAISLIRRHLDKHGFSDIQLTKIGGGDEWSQTSVNAPPVQAVLAVYRHYGIEPAILPRSPGSSPQAQFTRPPLNLPAAGGGLGHGGRAHSDDEYFVIEGTDKVGGLVECEQSMVDILYAYAYWPKS
jgi:acetylornithine deacetylase/succinyl-diaminopimelate desuccinylase-like protein